MSRALVVINSLNDRIRVADWAHKAPTGTRVEFKASKRTLPQNSLLWKLLTDVSRQREHYGKKYTPDEWKSIFLQAFGREQQFAPTLDGKGFFPLGNRSSDLSKTEMIDFIDFMLAWGAENNIVWSDPAEHRSAA